MIEGLIAIVSGTELRSLCKARADFHRGRSAEYAAQAAKFRDEADTPLPGGMSSSPRKSLEDKATEHADHAARMEFMAAHIVDAESYRLGNNDLAALGIVRRGY